MGKIITIKEYSEKIGVKYSTIRQRIIAGTFPARKSGSSWLVDEDTPWEERKRGGNYHTDKVKVGKGNMLTIAEYAALHRKKIGTVKMHIQKGRIPVEKVGNILLIEVGTPYPPDTRGGARIKKVK